MNALIDTTIIKALYRASMAGVKIELIVRGVCSLRAGVPGVSENITVRSILDRFLEHSRVFWFRNGGDDALFISSADWMTRNLDRRIEIVFPVHDAKVKKRLREILKTYLGDTVKARMLEPDGSYRRVEPGATPMRAQQTFLPSKRRS